MVYKIAPEPRVLHYLKKLKDRELKKRFLDIIYESIAEDPYLGEKKHGNLSEFYVWAFHYAKTDYRVAYIILKDKVVPIILAGSHENFYETLSRVDIGKIDD
ncbi:MAG: type II toxin-antitoxin system RelE/ParE family toxin [Streptococcaceae bacterium]|nr:type II toxin-antitoxin system RelE/ParE family toxin [Streptococcaceae bacterium]